MFSFEKVSEQPLLLFLMEPAGDLLGDQGSIAAGAVVDDEVDLDLVLYGLIHDFGRVLDPLQIQHAGDHLSNAIAAWVKSRLDPFTKNINAHGEANCRGYVQGNDGISRPMNLPDQHG